MVKEEKKTCENCKKYRETIMNLQTENIKLKNRLSMIVAMADLKFM